MGELDSTAGIVALAAGVAAGLALVAYLALALRVRRLLRGQRMVLGEWGERDLVEHARSLQERVDALQSELQGVNARLGARADEAERRLEEAISHAAVVRYDAYNEMTGRQSSSVALLDSRKTGVVISSILHREQARMYAKPIVGGIGKLDLSPEEQAAVDRALAGSRDLDVD